MVTKLGRWRQFPAEMAQQKHTTQDEQLQVDQNFSALKINQFKTCHGRLIIYMRVHLDLNVT